MAIVKAKYIRGKGRIKAHLRYIVHRRAETGETITRDLFDARGALTKQQAYALIDAARRGAHFHKFILNFHPTREDTHKDLNLWELTRNIITTITTRDGVSVPFVATIHNDHSLLRHVHGFFVVNGRLPRTEFAKIASLWRVATREARVQRTRLDRMRRAPRYRKLMPLIARFQRHRQQKHGRTAKPIRLQPGCPRCGFGQFTGIPFYRLTCPSCQQWLISVRDAALRGGRRLKR